MISRHGALFKDHNAPALPAMSSHTKVDSADFSHREVCGVTQQAGVLCC